MQERDNKLRMVQIGEYNTSRYKSHKDILKKIVYGIVVIILLTMLMSFDWFPKMVGTIGIIIVIAITLAFIASDLMENYSRSNLVWSQFTQPSDPAMLADQLAQGDQGSIWEANKKSFSKLYSDTTWSSFSWFISNSFRRRCR